MIDARQVAFVDGPLPQVEKPMGSGPGDEVLVTKYEPERIEIEAKSRSVGLLVVSETYANGWNAYVDGARVDVLRTNHAPPSTPRYRVSISSRPRINPCPVNIMLFHPAFNPA